MQLRINCKSPRRSLGYWPVLIYLLLLAYAPAVTSHASGLSSELEKGFRNPPESARPWVYWFVMDGNLSREGITADFEALKRAGVGGVIFMEVDVGIPRGPVKFMSPEWRALFKHAVTEAERLGLQITLNAGPGWTGSGGPWVKPEQSMQHIVASAVDVTGPKHFDEVLPRPQRRPAFFGDGQLPPELEKAKNDFYRDVMVLAFPTPAGNERISDIDEKALYVRAPYSSAPNVKARLPSEASYPAVPPEAVVAADRVVDLTAKLDAGGRLAWEVPTGKWTILRFGRTSNGAGTRPAPLPGLGLESDKFDKAALDAHFDAFIGALLREIGTPTNSAGAGWTMLHIDSWEMGAQNWTGGFREEFRHRRGYDPMRYLPAVTGRVVDSLEVSERFLWDLRQTAQELIIENHAEHLKALGHKHGLGLSIEPYDMMPCADMSIGAVADVPMCEFWLYGFDTAFSVIEVASIGHTCGRPVIAAESFTSGDAERWQAYPGAMKVLGDWAFSSGVNRIVVHRYQHQPWLDRKPGMTMGPYGVHWERTQTWWDMVGAYHEYLARCQFLLRQGLPVADICYLAPEGSPQVFRPPASAMRGNPPERLGYNFDGCAPETLMARMSVKDGRLVLPDGMSYGVLVLPETPTMTPTLLRKVKELVKAGATVVGPPPLKSPSLSGYPGCDAEVKKLAADMWGAGWEGNGSDGKNGSRNGARRVIWQDAWNTAKVMPDAGTALEHAKWIWHKEGNPAVSAPVGKRSFRRSFTLEGRAGIESALVSMTADNSFELWVNGREAGRGDNFHEASVLDIKPMLRAGVNVLGVAAENGGSAPNPAGLIGALVIKFRDGRTLTVTTDKDWQSAQAAKANWTTDTTAAGDWTAAMELGPMGMAPWGNVEKPSSEPNVFCDFNVISDLLAKSGLPPDFESDGPIRYTHRRTKEADIYFVANREDRRVEARCMFRVSGKAPELFDPLSGKVRDLPEFSSRDGRTTAPMRFEPVQSFFVIFRKSVGKAKTAGQRAIAQPLARPSSDVSFPLTPALSPRERETPRPALGESSASGMAKKRELLLPLLEGEGRGEGEQGVLMSQAVASPTSSRNFPVATRVAEFSGPWRVSFDPKWGGPENVTFGTLEDWSKRKEDGIKFYSGTAIYRKGFDALSLPGGQRIYLDLGAVKNLARVRLNGQDLGVVWCAPWRVDITGAVKARDNQLEIVVANLWPNRLIGDQSLPPEKRLAWTTWNPFKADSPLLESGLLGPVTLVAEKEVTVAEPISGRADAEGVPGPGSDREPLRAGTARGPGLSARATAGTILQDVAHGLVTMADGESNLVLRLRCDGQCLLDEVIVRGRQVVAPETGVCSAILVSNHWFTTRSGIASPKVGIDRNAVTVRDIVYGGEGVQVRETWKFMVQPEGIVWQIDREYLTGGRLDDTYFPGWDFKAMSTWTGGMLDDGGVAWNKYLETPNATYGAHADGVAFWNREQGDCLRIKVVGQGDRLRAGRFATERNAGETPGRAGETRAPLQHMAMRFSRQPSGIEAVAFSVTGTEVQPKHNLRRFLSSRQDLWAPFEVAPGRISARYSLQALDYDAANSRGTFQGLNGRSIREVLNTIGRYGVIDQHILGANGWRTGFTCLHEQWFAQMGIAIDDPDYLANCAATFDYERDHAIEPSGRVKSRWCYDAGDAMPGTYDTNGYYEAQWGYLLDSQPCYAICVAELFDQTGDQAWLRGQKAACERVLGYLLRRDADGDGLVEMMTDSHTQQRGSDWIDIIWAAHENALVNAELYYALTLWADAEEILGDAAQAAEYRQRAAKLKASYNKTTAEGGFWDPQNQWYVYWRDKDGTIHGNNFVTPVNLAAIGYGLCEDAGRREAILGRMEEEMRKENLFFWPLNFFPYQPDEGQAGNFPFPKYENGDIFLSWGELAVRAYAKSKPEIAVKYIKNILEKYEADGLSFQRYLRNSQRGAGEDILAGNCMPVVGLYRDVYGIQPKHNRLYLEPHLTPDLNGTRLHYNLRDQSYVLELNTRGSRMTVGDFAVQNAEPFALNVQGDTAVFFPGSRSAPGLSVMRSRRAPVEIGIDAWPASLTGSRKWAESCAERGVVMQHVVSDLQPHAVYSLLCNGRTVGSFKADGAGRIAFRRKLDDAGLQRFTLLIQ